MTGVRVVANVTELPTTTFGHRSLMWWGTLGFMMIEGSTLFICAVSYFYLRRNFQAWPPEGMLRPSLTIPTIQVALMVLSNIPVVMMDRAARRLDLRTVRAGMVVATLLLLELLEAAVMTPLLFSSSLEQKDIAGVADFAFYWYFLTGAWVPLYAIVFLSPYVS
jgi:heme/copper-type cytochrome/quinol oxidase subunit 3